MNYKEEARQILNKCEQYWNAPALTEEEMHAVLEFIHTRAFMIMNNVENRDE